MQKENATATPGLILKLNILEKRDETLLSIKNYYNNGTKKRSTKKKLSTGVKMIFIEIRCMLVRYKDYKAIQKVSPSISDYETLKKYVYSDDCEENIEAMFAMDIILDRKKLLKWDNYSVIDTFDLEAENKQNHC